jgi:hypothetical protein
MQSEEHALISTKPTAMGPMGSPADAIEVRVLPQVQAKASMRDSTAMLLQHHEGLRCHPLACCLQTTCCPLTAGLTLLA